MKKIGARIGNYIIKELLYETMNANIYKAIRCDNSGEQDELPYVIKEYKNTLMAKKEKEITQHIEATCNNSIVIPILHSENDDSGNRCLVMQSKERGGIFLARLIEELEKKYPNNRIPIEVQIEIIENILNSVKILHSSLNNDEKYQGYLHLDLHPGNIFVENADTTLSSHQIGSIKFIDFYNALPVYKKTKRALNSNDDIIGISIGFSAPELKRNSLIEYSSSADIYSVAAILARMYTGKKITNEFETYDFIIKESGDKYFENPVVDNIVKSFVLCGLEYNPKYRYQSADEMLDGLRKVKDCVKNKDSYYDLFSCAYELCVEEKDIDVKDIGFSKNIYCQSVESLDKALHSYNINRRKCKYIFNLLWKMFNINFLEVSKKTKCMLISSGIACNNHLGENDMALMLYEELQLCKKHMPIRDYLDVTNRCAVIFADSYQSKKAYNIMKKNVKSLEIIKAANENAALYNDLDPESSSRMIELGRAYSALGCYGSMLKKGDEPEEMFKKALNEFEDSLENQEITIAHILHYAIDNRRKDLYDEYISKYCQNDTNDIKEQIIDIIRSVYNNKNKVSLLYKLYTLLKGVYTFYIGQLNEEFINIIIDFINNKNIEKIGEHPLQFVYKYMGLITYEYYVKDRDVTDYMIDVNLAFSKSFNCVKEGIIDVEKKLNILMLITYQTMWVYNNLVVLDKDEREKENTELLNLIKEHAVRSGWMNLVDKLNDTGTIDNTLNFEYC